MAKSADAWGGGGHIFTAFRPLLRKALHRINHAAEQKVEEALDIIDKPERKDDGAFRKF